MTLLAAFLSYFIKFILFGGVIVGAVFCGIRLRKKKDEKNQETKQEESK